MKITKLMLLGFILLQAFIGSVHGVFDPRDTRQIAIDIDTTLTTCCATLQSDFNGTFTTLKALGDLIAFSIECTPVLITQAMVGTTGFVITQSGVYQLSQNIVFSPVAAASAITINASNVVLDLQCFSITQGNATLAVNGVSIGANQTNITINSGLISGMTGNGINISSGVSNVIIMDTHVLLSRYGIFCNGTSPAPILTMIVSGVDLLGNGTGASFNFCKECQINDSAIIKSTSAGLEFVSSFSNRVNSCTIGDTQASVGNAFGVRAVSGGDNRFENCLIDNTSAVATFTAAGISFDAFESNDIIANNQISNTTAPVGARPFGITVASTFTSINTNMLPNITGTIAVNSLEWTPDGRYLAAASGSVSGGTITVYEFNGNIMSIAAFSDTNAQAVSWSPDGSYLATGDIAGPAVLAVYQFNGSSLVLKASVNPGAGGINAVDWSPNGRFIAIGTASSPEVSVYEFDGTALVLITTFVNTGAVNSVNWSPDSQYLAIGSSAAVNQIKVLKFNGVNLTLSAQFAHGANVNSVNWSPDGRKIVIGGAESPVFDVRVLNFTGASLVNLASFDHGAVVHSVRWSPDQQFIVLGATASGGSDVQALRFNGNSLTIVSSFNNGATVQAVSWAPGSNLIAIGGNPTGASVIIRLLNALQFPAGTIIRNNLIINTNGPALAAGVPGVSTGVGLSASSASSLIIQNIAFNNDLNYNSVTNIFQQFLANTQSQNPSLIANLSFPPL